MANANPNQQQPEPRRVREFANFFKRYMSISSVIAAALPIPVTAVGLLPTFSAQTSYLTTYASMFCFLSLGFVFYSRHQLARRMFPELLPRQSAEGPSDIGVKRTIIRSVAAFATRMLTRFGHLLSRLFVPILPVLLIAGALYCIWAYHSYLNAAVANLRGVTDEAAAVPKTSDVLQATPFDEIPFSLPLSLYYIGIFVTAESAFIVMAIKEYLQDLLGLTDLMILGVEPPPDGLMSDRAESVGPAADGDADY